MADFTRLERHCKLIRGFEYYYYIPLPSASEPAQLKFVATPKGAIVHGSIIWVV
jgi:hypothetical protein